MKRVLRGLGEGTSQDQRQDPRIVRGAGQTRVPGQQFPQAVRAGRLAEQHESGQHGQGSHSGDQQGLQRRAPHGRVLVLVADQEERCQGGEFPKDEQGDQVVRQHQPQHREHEGQEKRGEAQQLRVAQHVLARVEHDQRADSGDEQGEEQAQPVDKEAQRDALLRDPADLPIERSAGRDVRHQRTEPSKQGGRQRYRRPQ